MVKSLDLIVRSRVTGKVSQLSDDESTVYTDYTITAGRVLKKPVGWGSSSVQGPVPQIILRRVGGLVVVDGLHLETQTDAVDRDKPIGVGDEYVFFLMSPVASSAMTKHARSGVFELTCGEFALFPIRNGKLESFTRLAAGRRPLATDDPEAFLSSVQQWVAAKRTDPR